MANYTITVDPLSIATTTTGISGTVYSMSLPVNTFGPNRVIVLTALVTSISGATVPPPTYSFFDGLNVGIGNEVPLPPPVDTNNLTWNLATYFLVRIDPTIFLPCIGVEYMYVWWAYAPTPITSGSVTLQVGPLSPMVMSIGAYGECDTILPIENSSFYSINSQSDFTGTIATLSPNAFIGGFATLLEANVHDGGTGATGSVVGNTGFTITSQSCTPHLYPNEQAYGPAYMLAANILATSGTAASGTIVTAGMTANEEFNNAGLVLLSFRTRQVDGGGGGGGVGGGGVPVSGWATLPSTGNTPPLYQNWTITDPYRGRTYMSGNPQGWSVSYNNSIGVFTIGASNSAVIGPGYVVSILQPIPYSAPFIVVPNPPSPLLLGNIPSNLTASASGNIITLHWTGDPATQYYYIYQGFINPSANMTYIGFTTNTTYSLTVPLGTLYTYAISSVNYQGMTLWSTPAIIQM